MTAGATGPAAPRSAWAAGAGCYFIWGLIPLLFQAIGRLGATPWEILAHRTVWGVPAALGFVLIARQGPHAWAVLRNPRTLAWLALSALLIGSNWAIFIWAANSGRVLETSLGYYVLPLLNIAAGALIFRERIDRAGQAAIAIAGVGVVLQAVAVGGLPWVALALAVTFGGYGIVRKRVAAEAQTGLLVECLLLAAPGLAYVVWLESSGGGRFLESPAAAAWLLACGPLTALPLVLFAWAARRIPLSAMGFLQFISPTMTFVIGVLQGEPFNLLRGVSFILIWAGVAAFAWGVWQKSRPELEAVTEPAG
jgi:chloramphenicol-sensitive protein RarD